MTAAPVPRPIAWRIHPDDAARLAAEGQHCGTRRCHTPAVVVTWHYWRSTEAGRVLVAEHLACDEHGQEFATRHHIQIDPPPGQAVSARGRVDQPPAAQRLFPGDLLAEFLERGEDQESGPRARLAGMTAGQLAEHAALGWHCDFPRCPDPARYLSSLRYVTGGGQTRQRGRFLCDRHARNFAARHGLDIAAVLPP